MADQPTELPYEVSIKLHLQYHADLATDDLLGDQGAGALLQENSLKLLPTAHRLNPFTF